MIDDDLNADQSFAATERRVAVLVRSRLNTLGSNGFPRFAAATESMLNGGSEYADFVIEIAPGITILEQLIPTLEEFKVAGSEGRMADRVCDRAMQASYAAAELAPSFRSMAENAASLVADAKASGLPAELISVHLAGMSLWELPDDAQFVVTIETLGENLKPRDCSMKMGSKEALERLFSRAMEGLAPRTVARERLNDVGADGCIDLLSLNAIGRTGDVMPILRTMASNEHRLTNGLELRWEDGVIHSANSEGRVAWDGAVLWISDLALPPTVCINAIGRPVSELIDHPALDPQIHVRRIDNYENEDGDFVMVGLDIPILYFNVEAEKIWPA